MNRNGNDKKTRATNNKTKNVGKRKLEGWEKLIWNKETKIRRTEESGKERIEGRNINSW